MTGWGPFPPVLLQHHHDRFIAYATSTGVSLLISAGCTIKVWLTDGPPFGCFAGAVVFLVLALLAIRAADRELAEWRVDIGKVEQIAAEDQAIRLGNGHTTDTARYTTAEIQVQHSAPAALRALPTQPRLWPPTKGS